MEEDIPLCLLRLATTRGFSILGTFAAALFLLALLSFAFASSIMVWVFVSTIETTRVLGATRMLLPATRYFSCEAMYIFTLADEIGKISPTVRRELDETGLLAISLSI